MSAQLLSLEVGEHIPPEFEQNVFDNLAATAAGRAVVSWAVPGQGGLGHVNERPNDHVIEQLVARGWQFLPDATAALRRLDFGECHWFARTLLAFDVASREA